MKELDKSKVYDIRDLSKGQLISLGDKSGNGYLKEGRRGNYSAILFCEDRWVISLTDSITTNALDLFEEWEDMENNPFYKLFEKNFIKECESLGLYNSNGLGINKKVGDKVKKPKGYEFFGTVVSVFKTTKGETRIVAEMEDNGSLHIFNEKQLEILTPEEIKQRESKR